MERELIKNGQVYRRKIKSSFVGDKKEKERKESKSSVKTQKKKTKLSSVVRFRLRCFCVHRPLLVFPVTILFPVCPRIAVNISV